jgi:hypothetical protein
MPRKTPKRKLEDAGGIIDSIKTLVIEGINLYIKIKPLVKKTKKRKKQNDRSNIQNQ